MKIEYRLGLPTIEQVRAHETRGGWWMGRYPEKQPIPPQIGRFDQAMRFTNIKYITDSPSSVLEYRPCLPDGTPCPWPEILADRPGVDTDLGFTYRTPDKFIP